MAPPTGSNKQNILLLFPKQQRWPWLPVPRKKHAIRGIGGGAALASPAMHRAEGSGLSGENRAAYSSLLALLTDVFGATSRRRRWR